MKFVTLDFGRGIVWVVEGSQFNPLAQRIIFSVLKKKVLPSPCKWLMSFV